MWLKRWVEGRKGEDVMKWIRSLILTGERKIGSRKEKTST